MITTYTIPNNIAFWLYLFAIWTIIHTFFFFLDFEWVKKEKQKFVLYILLFLLIIFLYITTDFYNFLQMKVGCAKLTG